MPRPPQAGDRERPQLASERAAVAAEIADYESSARRYDALERFFRRWTPDDPFLTLVVILALLMVGTVVKGIFLFAQQVLVGGVTQRAMLDLRSRFYRRTLRMDLAGFSAEGSNELMSRFTYDMESLGAGIDVLLGKVIREPIKALACVGIACYLNWRLTLLSAVVAPVAGYAMVRMGKLMKRASRRTMESMSRIYKVLEESFAGIKVVKAFTMERYERRRFRREAKDYYQKSMRIVRVDALASPITELGGLGAIVVALLAGAYLVMSGETHLFGIRMTDRPLDTSTLATLYAMLAGVSDPARKLSNVFNRLQRAAAAADRIFAYMDREPRIVDPPSPKPLPRHSSSLEFLDVTFSYRQGAASPQPSPPSGGEGRVRGPGQRALDGVTLKIPFGETIALVGPNGCGKTTLVNLVPRFFDPDAGQVLLDGVDLREAAMRDIRSQIGLVTQETVLFDDTVRNNIAYGNRSVPDEAVRDAARRAHAHRFIEELPQGYDTPVGEKGMRLSGGQRQRIALARAILRDPAILILDEATSAIDPVSEQLIHQALEEFAKGRTTIMVTHRLSTLALAQRIVVMDGGRIHAIGTHDELSRSSPTYRRLYEGQLQRESA